MRLLIVEDSDLLRQNLSEGLAHEGYLVDSAADGELGLYMAQEHDYSVIILDLMLPKRDGWSLLRALRASGRRTPVLCLTALDQVDERIRGLREGADDYLCKPFDFDELLARIEALARRAHGHAHNRLQLGDLVLDLGARVLSRGGQRLALARREFALLELLMLRRGSVVSRAEIEAQIYDEQVAPMSNVVEAAVSTLRRLIDQPGQPSLITTRRGHGYTIEQ